MSREDILDRVLYGYFLEQLYSTACGRLDKFLSVLTLILGSSIVMKANPFIFGLGIVIITAIQTTYEFGKKSGNARRKSMEYLSLFDDEASFDENALKSKFKDLEKTDNAIWSSLKPVALLKTQIKIGLPVEHCERLPLLSRIIRLLSG
ncbi:TPA: hypothetical protein H2C15_003937 [Salmonella enterica]|nr:hypothetical protein [Salmonella enterica]